MKLLNVVRLVFPSRMRLRAIGILSLTLGCVVGPSARCASEVQTTVGLSATSQYLFRGMRLGGPALQPYVQLDSGNLALGVWGSTPLAARVPGQSDPEIDPYGWYRIPLTETVSVQPGITVYTFPNADRHRGFHRVVTEPSLALNYTVRGAVLTPKVYYDLARRGVTAELNVAYALPLRSLGTELDFNASAGTYRWNDALADGEPRVKNWGDYWQVGAAVPYQIFASRVTLGVAYAAGNNNYLKTGSAPKRANPLAARRLIATLTYTQSF